MRNGGAQCSAEALCTKPIAAESRREFTMAQHGYNSLFDTGLQHQRHCASRPFPPISLDFHMNQTDNMSVVLVMGLIYSPSDMPKGLWRGFAFSGGRAEGVYHAG